VPGTPCFSEGKRPLAREIKTRNASGGFSPDLYPEKHYSRKRDCNLSVACLSARKWCRKRSRFTCLCRSKTKEKRNIPHNVIPVLSRERHVSLKVKDLSQERLRLNSHVVCRFLLFNPEKHSSRKRDCSLAAACLSARSCPRKRVRDAHLIHL